MSSAPEKSLEPVEIFHNQDLREHDITRELIRDVRSELRGRFDRMESKVVGDPSLQEFLRKLDRIERNEPG